MSVQLRFSSIPVCSGFPCVDANKYIGNDRTEKTNSYPNDQTAHNNNFLMRKIVRFVAPNKAIDTTGLSSTATVLKSELSYAGTFDYPSYSYANLSRSYRLNDFYSFFVNRYAQGPDNNPRHPSVGGSGFYYSNNGNPLTTAIASGGRIYQNSHKSVIDSISEVSIFKTPKYFRTEKSYSIIGSVLSPLEFPTYTDPNENQDILTNWEFIKTVVNTEAKEHPPDLEINMTITTSVNKTNWMKVKLLNYEDSKTCLATDSEYWDEAFFNSLSSPTFDQAISNGGAQYFGIYVFEPPKFNSVSVTATSNGVDGEINASYRRQEFKTGDSTINNQNLIDEFVTSIDYENIPVFYLLP